MAISFLLSIDSFLPILFEFLGTSSNYDRFQSTNTGSPRNSSFFLKRLHEWDYTPADTGTESFLS